MAKNYFIAGTDTSVGKTFIACALMKAAQRTGLTTAAIKPVAAGCELIDGQLKNDDALLLQQCMSKDLDYDVINPVALELAIAPHIAAQKAGKNITVSRLTGYCRGTLMCAGQFNVVEGAGGWRVPLNNRETMADLVKELRLPVILVVGMRLGCINHTLLTVEAMLRDGLNIAGWIANCIDPNMPALQENIDSIETRLAFPLLAKVDFIHQDDLVASIDRAAEQIDLVPLLG